MKQFTFLILIVVGCTMLVLDRDTAGIGQRPGFVWIAEHPQACTRNITGPTVSRASILATVRARELQCRVAQMHARLRASLSKIQAQRECLVNSFTQKLTGKPCASTSPAWRDIHYDAQMLAKVFGICKQTPV